MLVDVPDWYNWSRKLLERSEGLTCTQLWTNYVRQLSSSSCFIWRRTASARSIRLILRSATAFKAKLISISTNILHLQFRPLCLLKHQKESVVVLLCVKVVCYNRKQDGTLFQFAKVRLYQLYRLFYEVFVDFLHSSYSLQLILTFLAKYCTTTEKA